MLRLGESIVRAIDVFRGVIAIIGRPVLVRALTTLVLVGIPSAIVFSPSGMRAEDLVHALQRSPYLRAALWALWLLLAAPSTNAVFQAPGSMTLRSLRPPRAPLLLALLLLASLVHAPWILLFARGAGAGAACAAASLAVAIEAAMLAALRRRTFTVLAAAGVAIVLLDLPSPWAALAGLPLALLAVLAAWKVAPEQRGGTFRLTRPTRPVLALVMLHLLRLLRRGRSRLTIATFVSAVGAAGLFTLRSDPTEHPYQRALLVMAPPFLLVAAICVAPILESERCVRTLLRSLRIRRVVVVAAFLLALVTPASALAASATIATRMASGPVTLSMMGALVLWACVLSSAIGVWARMHDRTRRRSASVFALGVIALGLLAIGAVAIW